MPQPTPGTLDNNQPIFQGPSPRSMFMFHQVLFQISTKVGHQCLSYYRGATGNLKKVCVEPFMFSQHKEEEDSDMMEEEETTGTLLLLRQ